ncbi:MAG TPA: helix-turn-helix domain-containing protein, partial [Stellaceae bacterium]|nr:helix-turn-helix domain-containing protein [Stellaceae bacterium]
MAELRPGRRRSVGQLLRETRESYGSDIPRVAAALRIRATYLEAIEEGRYDRLPGPVYALGFVRAYAVHLGLDGEEAVRRFKLEAEGFEAQRDLSFPVPLAERSMPGGAMVLAALILAVCAYGIWYYLSSSRGTRPERVTPVPAELAQSAAPAAPSHATPGGAQPSAPTAAMPAAPAAATPAA